MYMRGMGDYYNDDEFLVYDGESSYPTVDVFPVYDATPMPSAVPAGQPGGVNWAQLLNTAINTYGQITVTKSQIDAASRPKALPLYPGYPGYVPPSSPFPGVPGYPGAGSNIPWGTLLIAAAAVVGVSMLSSK